MLELHELQVDLERDDLAQERTMDYSEELHRCKKAGFGRRAAALAFDQIFLVGTFYLGTLAVDWFREVTSFSGIYVSPALRIDMPVATLAVLLFAYHPICWWLTGQTLGKYLLKIKVVSVEGGKVGFFQAWSRFFAYFISSLLFYLGFFWAAWDKNEQAWHDKIAQTYVINVSA